LKMKTIYSAIIIITLTITTLCILSFGNPQWGKSVYMWQAYVYPAKMDRPVTGTYPSGKKFSQPPVPVISVPSKNYKTGTWRTWHKNGHKHYEIEHVNGKYHGTFKVFYDNGQLHVQQHYKNHVCDGLDSGYFRNGDKYYLAPYVTGKPHGIWTHWYAAGNKRHLSVYVDGQLHGTEKSWYENGNRYSEVSYKKGKKHGLDQCWDENGNLNWSRRFENGVHID